MGKRSCLTAVPEGDIRTPIPTIRKCPRCGEEIFSNDVSAKCSRCGFTVCDDILSSVQWCAYARACVGDVSKTDGQEA